MLFFANRLQKFNVQATDDQLGKVKDIYFDEDNWVVRYLVTDTQKWLPGRKVLISPATFDHIDFENSLLNIKESKERIKDSPSIEEHKPVSRKQESMLNTYFGWPHYWDYIDNQGAQQGNHDSYDKQKKGKDEEKFTPEQEQDEKLRSMDEIKGDFSGYTIQATDGEIGHVADFIIDDDNWKVRYFIVETKRFLPGKYVVLSVDWIKDISWQNQKVTLDLPKEVIENGPFFELDEPFTREDEKNLYQSYSKTPYF